MVMPLQSQGMRCAARRRGYDARIGNNTVGMAGIVLRKKAAGLLHDFNPGDWQSLDKVCAVL
jgi:hypothetical protein